MRAASGAYYYYHYYDYYYHYYPEVPRPARGPQGSDGGGRCPALRGRADPGSCGRQTVTSPRDGRQEVCTHSSFTISTTGSTSLMNQSLILSL